MGIKLAIADACRTADVSYDDLALTIAAGSYPCLPGAARGSPRTFDETDLLALYVYGRCCVRLPAPCTQANMLVGCIMR